ncbi:MAG: arginine repressor [Pyrinomonadaceae bacterium]
MKAQRHKAIVELVSRRRVTRQGEISAALAKKGFEVTQASISRDLEELGIAKVDGRYTLPQRTFGPSVDDTLTLVPAGDNLLVAKCRPGMASALAVRIDAAKIREIVGTIAGDDTIFIAVADAAAQRTVIKKILEL